MRTLHLEGFVATGLPCLTRVLAHHDPNAAQGAEGIRAWLGEAWVHQVSVTFHATGALLVAGGLAAILLMRTLGKGEGGALWTDRTRSFIRLAVLGGWGFNFLGGIMRLYEPDHPGLTSIGEVAWVQVLVLKHFALVGAVLFSLLAIEMGPEAWTRRLRQHAAIALVLVLFASVSGGVATGLPLPGMGGDMDMEGGTAAEERPTGTLVTWRNATVEFAGATLLTPRTQTIELDVPLDAVEFWVGLEWTSAQSSIWAEAVDPSGEVVAKSGNASDTDAELTVARNVPPGTWSLRIRSDQAVSENVQVFTKITQGGSGIRVLEETVSIVGRGFEVNLWMDPGDYFNFTWSLAPGDAAISWDIHSHPEDQVEVHQEGVDTEGSGNFTAGPNEVYSIFWHQPAAGQVPTLTYRLEGNFTIHSIFRGL